MKEIKFQNAPNLGRFFMFDITMNNYTSKPKQFADFKGQYNYFLGLFYKNSPYAGKGQINPNLMPTALLTIFSNSNCK
jgi:hypothetical protein